MSPEVAATPIVAVQGAPGCFSDVAARRVLGEALSLLSCRSFEEVAESLRQGRCEYGVFPVENSIAGPVQAARVALAGGGFTPVGELLLPIEQCLLVLPGATPGTLQRVISHPVALAQCGDFLRRLAGVAVEAVWDTAAAAAEVAAGGAVTVGAIAGREAAERYGLEVAVASVADRADNRTRFVVVRAGAELR